jgi:hypothetical protein
MHPGVGGRRLAATALALLIVVPGAVAAHADATGHKLSGSDTASGSAAGTHKLWAPTPGMSRAGCGTFTKHHQRWTCTFDDEFSVKTHDAAQLRPRWWRVQKTADSGYYTGPPGRQACYFNHPQNVWVADGSLHLRALQLPHEFPCLTGGGLTWLIRNNGSFTTRYTAGMVSTWHRFAQKNGRFAVRAKVPAAGVPGLQETLWLYPINPSKYGGHGKSGEIDFAEFYSHYPAKTVPMIHYLPDSEARPPATDPTRNATSARCPIHRGKFNTYVAQWSPGRIKITVNGVTCLIDNYHPFHIAPPAPFDQPFMVVLTQALGVRDNAFSAANTPLPATTTVDWVRIWKRS